MNEGFGVRGCRGRRHGDERLLRRDMGVGEHHLEMGSKGTEEPETKRNQNSLVMWA